MDLDSSQVGLRGCKAKTRRQSRDGSTTRMGEASIVHNLSMIDSTFLVLYGNPNPDRTKASAK
jgi:hypothetical protein